MALRLRGAFSPNPRVAPLVDGTVRATGIDLEWAQGTPGDLHERHLRDGAHDVFEFSISNYLVTRERARPLWDWLLIPVFASKATLGLHTLVNARAGIGGAADLAGRRFGIPDYTMTAGLWFRAQLGTLYGIGPRDIEWHVARQGEQSHGRQLGFDTDPPRGVTLRWAGVAEVDRMLQAGELDAAFPSADVRIDTSTGNVRPLFPDGGRQFFADFHAKAGFLPVNHVVLVRRRLVEEHPWVPEALFAGFEAAKAAAYRRDPASARIFGEGDEFGDDPFPYGLAANRATLAMAARQSNLDGLTVKRWDLADFVPETLLGS